MSPPERITKLETQVQELTAWKMTAEERLQTHEDKHASYREQRAYVLGVMGAMCFASGSGWFSLKNIAEWILKHAGQ